MEMTYTNNILYINIEERINFSLIKKLKYRLFYLIDSYGIEEIILNINDNHYDTSLIMELINEYNMKYNGKLTVK
jgi:hypothetical protein